MSFSDLKLQFLEIVPPSSTDKGLKVTGKAEISATSVTTGDALTIGADGLTTGNAITISSDALTTGSALDITSTATAYETTGSLVKVVQSGSNASNVGAILDLQSTGANSALTPLKITNSETVSATTPSVLFNMLGGSNSSALRLEYKETDITIADDVTTSVAGFFEAYSVPLFLVLRTTTVIPSAANITDIGIGSTAVGFSTGNHSGTDEIVSFHQPVSTVITNAANGFGHSSAQLLLLTHGDPGAATGRVRAALWYYVITPPVTV